MYIISACLLGENCKYSGGNNKCSWVCEFAESHDIVPVCPEVAGGLPTPRAPSEIIKTNDEKRVVDKEGKDVTENFKNGAVISLKKAEEEAEKCGKTLKRAILKACSPSCGSGLIYDGTFSKVLVPGNGVFAEMLKEHGIPVISENDESEKNNL